MNKLQRLIRRLRAKGYPGRMIKEIINAIKQKKGSR